jgi:hypothetical protein
MSKSPDSHQRAEQRVEAKDPPDTPEDDRTGKPAAGGWPFAPGSQLSRQVARPWVPKPVYRFNQR